MGRRPGSKNAKTIEREQQELRARAADAPDPAEGGLLAQFRAGGVREEEDETLPGGFLEYQAADGSWWRLELGEEWRTAFTAVDDEAGRWHEAFSNEAEGWRLLRLLYGVAPLSGESNLDYMRPHSREETARMLDVDPAAVDAQLEDCRVFWARWKAQSNAEGRMTNDEGSPAFGGGERQRETAKPLGLIDLTEIRVTLREHGFDDLEREADQVYAARRLADLAPKIDDDQGRPIAYRAIRLEIQLSLYDRLLQDAAKERAAAKDSDGKLAWSSEIQKLTTQQKSVNTDYLTVMKALEATQAQNPSVRRKVAFKDCISQLLEAIREYHANGNNALVDGVFTAAEIKLLTTRLSLRAPQYRPDIVAVINDAMASHNLWDPNYIPPTMERGVHRRFMKAWSESLEAARQEDGEPVVDMEEGMGAVEDSAPVEVLGTPPPSAAEAAVSAPFPRGGVRPGEDVV